MGEMADENAIAADLTFERCEGKGARAKAQGRRRKGEGARAKARERRRESEGARARGGAIAWFIE